MGEVRRFASWTEFNEAGSLFFGAYVDVVGSPQRWVWICELLAWVFVGIAFLVKEARVLQLSKGEVFAFVVVGFLGAISVSFGLFFAVSLLVRARMPPPSPRHARLAGRPDAALWWGTIAGMVSTVMLPVSLEKGERFEFNVHLLVVHAVLLLPAVVGVGASHTPEPSSSSSSATSSVSKTGSEDEAWRRFAAFAALFGFVAHVANWARVLAAADFAPLNAVASVLRGSLDNDCTTSVTADVWFITLMSALYSRARFGTSVRSFVGVSALASPAVASAWAFFFSS